MTRPWCDTLWSPTLFSLFFRSMNLGCCWSSLGQGAGGAVLFFLLYVFDKDACPHSGFSNLLTPAKTQDPEVVSPFFFPTSFFPPTPSLPFLLKATALRQWIRTNRESSLFLFFSFTVARLGKDFRPVSSLSLPPPHIKISIDRQNKKVTSNSGETVRWLFLSFLFPCSRRTDN